MKNFLLICVTTLLLTSYTAFSGFSLQVQDPKNTWKYARGSIDSTTLVISPKGKYFLYDLYLVFSSNGSSYRNVTDTLEVQYFFDLHKDAIVTDSWLWVEDTLVKAKLIDRWTASQIYEGIVQRRRDPSVFYKNTPTGYEMRIFPLVGSKTRKIKISWMEPITWSGNTVSAKLPISMLLLANVKGPTKIIALTDDSWKNPALSFESTFPNMFNPVKDPIYGSIYEGTYNISSLNSGNSYYINYDNPMQNGIFFRAYKENNEDGFFELSLQPKSAFDLNNNRNIFFILDYDINFSKYPFDQIVTSLKNYMLSNLSPRDSFNLILSSYDLKKLSNNWIQATPENIQNAFKQFTYNDITLYSVLPQLLFSVRDYFKSKTISNSSIAVITSSENFGKPEIANNIIHNLLDTIKVPPIYVCDFANYKNTYKVNNITYYGNGYLYTNICKLTGGEYLDRNLVLNDAINNLIANSDAKFITIEINTSFSEGITYSKFTFDQGITLNYVNPVTIVGKYFGQGTFKVELSGLLKAEKPYLVHKVIEIPSYDVTNKFTKTNWIGKYIQNLESMTNTNSIVSEIINTSMDNRVLSLYTAFLALEPWMTGNSSSDDENKGGNTVVEESYENISLKAFPNPFTTNLNISINLVNKTEIISSVEIYNSNGQIVTQFDISQFFGQESVDFKWDGRDSSGRQLPNGIYLIVIKSNSSAKTMKVILNR